ncbi:MAG: RNA recognition motif domain-containing protein [Planctomycetota bacterium]
MNIYVGNLARETTPGDLREAFAAFGQVESVKIMKDRVSGESLGYGFVLMPSKIEGEAAIAGLQGKDLGGQALKVEEGQRKSRQTGLGGGRGGRRGREGPGGGPGRGGRGSFARGGRGGYRR